MIRIDSPDYPETKLAASLQSVETIKLINTTNKKLLSDSDDRKTSQLYSYHYNDNSRLLSTMVRVKKKDDFKIEAYGPLSKGIKEIYIKNPSRIQETPVSIAGLIDNKSALQTCIIPGSKRLDEVNVGLTPLTNTIQQLRQQPRSLLGKILGTQQIVDYSCLVVTYIPHSDSSDLSTKKRWATILSQIQQSLP